MATEQLTPRNLPRLAKDKINALFDEKVNSSLFDANTILAADTDDTPAALTIAEQRIVGRITSGNITGLTAAQVRTLLNVEDGATDETWNTFGPITLSTGSPTAVSLFSGASDVEEIEIYVTGFSTGSANKAPLIQIGPSGGVETSGYSGLAWSMSASNFDNDNNSSGFLMCNNTTHDAGTTSLFNISLRHMGSNFWAMGAKGSLATPTRVIACDGDKSLAGALTQVTITTEVTAATIDGGTAYARYR